jgi:two-component system, OmpR family, phosphate regulon sensor histidine kinase PhoR
VTLPHRWISQLGALTGLLAGALLLGLWFGGMGWWLSGALLLYVGHTLRHLYALDRVLDGQRRVPLFETRGFWAELLARVDKLRAKARNRKKKYHRLLREVRESTGALSDGGIILNSNREILWFNPAAARLLGLNAATDIGNRIDNLLRHPSFAAYLTAPKPEGIALASPKTDGGWLTVQVIPYGRDQSLAIIHDITHEMNLERTRRDFVANASHELRSPLTVISGYIDALAEDSQTPEAWRAPVAEMQRQAERMTGILRDLIELTRLESADSSAARDFVDVVAMLRPITAEFQGRGLTVTLMADTDAALLGRESELHSIFFNLVNNAVRFTPAGGSVRIVWRLEDGGAVFEVVDTGIGIAQEQIPRVTERFYRVDPGRSRATGGTGLGLAIVKHALQRHDARLTIESREGKGSTFSCHFPRERVVLRANAIQAVQ